MYDEGPKNEITNPTHYTYVPGIETGDVAQNYTFWVATAIKYIWRAGHKPGVPVAKDIRKAIECLENWNRMDHGPKGLLHRVCQVLCRLRYGLYRIPYASKLSMLHHMQAWQFSALMGLTDADSGAHGVEMALTILRGQLEKVMVENAGSVGNNVGNSNHDE